MFLKKGVFEQREKRLTLLAIAKLGRSARESQVPAAYHGSGPWC